MKATRFTAQFEAEAINRILDHGHSVLDVSLMASLARLNRISGLTFGLLFDIAIPALRLMS